VKTILKSLLKAFLPYGIVCWWLRTRRNLWIEWPLAYYPGLGKRLRRLLKFATPFLFVRMMRVRRPEGLSLLLPEFISRGPLPVARRRPRPIRGRTPRVVVIVPVYRVEPGPTEAEALKHNAEVLASHEIRLVCPEGLDTSAYDRIVGRRLPAETFGPSFFAGIDGYNRLMTDVSFYDRFAGFDYLLVCQLDAWVFRDELLDWCAKGYDYIGAPWFEDFRSHETGAKLWAVGNGGFSLRRTDWFRTIVRSGVPRELMLGLHNTYEDYCYAVLLAGTGYELCIPTPDEAMHFAFERSPDWLYEQTGHRLPFGCHAWEENLPLAFYAPFISARLPKPSGRKLSVITVCRNDLAGLKRTAGSILAQSWRDFEWIIIDGGSTDGSREYIEQTLAPYAAYWCSEPDGGVYFGMNKGISHAKGEYLNFMNSGDFFYDHGVLRQIFSADSAADVIYGDACYFTHEGYRIVRFPDWIPFGFFKYDNICHQTMFIRRKAIGLGYDVRYRIHADRAKWIELQAERRSFRLVPRVVCSCGALGELSATDRRLAFREEKRLGIQDGSFVPAPLRPVRDGEPTRFVSMLGKGLPVRFSPTARPVNWRGRGVSRKTGRLAVFATYTHDGRIYPRDLALLAGLRTQVDAIIVVGDALLEPEEEEKLKPYAVAIVFERHGEYDFGSYRRGYEVAEEMGLLTDDADLILMNNSCYGWLYPLAEVIEEMADRACDFWGLTANEWHDVYHVQSYFYYFRSSLVSGGALGDFLMTVHGKLRFLEVIARYELGLTRYLQDRGYRWDTLVPFGIVRENPMILPVTMDRRYRMPLLKVKAIQGETLERMEPLLRRIRETNPSIFHAMAVEFPSVPRLCEPCEAGRTRSCRTGSVSK